MAMIGSVLGAVGSLISVLAAMQQAQYQAAIAEHNAKIQELNADLAAEAGRLNAEDAGLAGARDLGEFDAAVGASGIAFSSPSATRSRGALSRDIQTSQLREEYAGRQQATAFENRARQERLKADMYSGQAGFAGAAALVGFAGGLAESFAGGAQPSIQTPGFLGVPQQRNQIQTQINQGAPYNYYAPRLMPRIGAGQYVSPGGFL